ncbi:hypothetical protein [Staphylococcus equorum]|uniref:hypothetical protein n=1 Tax=Staphylococcus equorum TaxID=246432 RepID=UPI000853DE80|nr:hypothetical protein [Staphylococcus equorum]OEL08321.1 hypothetical protein AST04_08475 [Staphylococcus equorum]
MEIKGELDKGYFISTLLNVFFLLGLTFIFQIENLFLLVTYVVVMMINAIYLVVKSGRNWANKSL